MRSLEERIARAFGDDAMPDDIARLIEEAEAASAAAIEASEQARERALDPALPPAEAEQARGDADTAAFRPRPAGGGGAAAPGAAGGRPTARAGHEAAGRVRRRQG
jgi:hypothetical protein